MIRLVLRNSSRVSGSNGLRPAEQNSTHPIIIGVRYDFQSCIEFGVFLDLAQPVTIALCLSSW